MTESRILVLDDDAAYSAELKQFLQFHGYDVNTVHESSAFEAALAATTPDILLIDKCLTDTTATTILRRLRERTDIPCIIITGRSDPMDRIVHLELGADDEVDKSLQPRELLARIRTVLRRARGARPSPQIAEPAAAPPKPRGGWRLSTTRRELIRPDGGICKLTMAEFETLQILVEASGAPVSRAELCSRVFRRPLTPSERAVDTVVRKIREKVRLSGGADPIKSVRNVGYVFVGFAEQ
jgi:DNA-binding response OmpR family regulator